MKMADRYRQSISRVVRFGNAVQPEQRLDHLLHLEFFGVSMANDCLFHQPGRVLMNRDRRALGSEHGHAAHLPQFQSDFHIGRQKAIFNCTSLRAVTLNHIRQRIGNFQQPGGKPLAVMRANRPAFNQPVVAGIALNNAPPGAFAAWIDS